ncbi:hypothetical protein [Enhygromyxa salina]|uniref:Uncharacterized protein n=1 Tax=Enhygromyxa salina TaxID=215803 RepID=A0A2S9Y0K6_9BACT|nr:hypothetical protein [Enhygromyxa salina]PRP98629.1 hypothetical protein ENSA7_65720 [Enhygromyxa salina]
MHSSQLQLWSVDKLDAPRVWAGRPSIFDHVERELATLRQTQAEPGEQASDAGEQASDALDGGGLELALPDDEQHERGGLRWAAGALDGVMGRHAQIEDERLRAKQIVKAVRDLLDSARPAHLEHLTRLLTRAPVLGVLDDVLGELVGNGELDPDRFHELALFLVRGAPDREVVKLGISMLGVLVGCDERDTLLTIGHHEEFTLFCVVALASTLEAADRELWQLAKGVRGWGRIHAVERLAQTCDPEIRAWLVRQGFRNQVMDEYLAHTCAIAGDLAGALEADIVDDPLLDGAAGILAALLNGGPAEDIEDYEHAPRAASAYLRHLARRPEHRTLDLAHLLVVEQLREFIGPVGDELEDDETLRELGWTLEIRRVVLDMCARVVARPEWPRLVQEGLETESLERFHQADAAAQLLGIDAWSHHLRRVQASPRSSPSWFRLVQTEDDDRFAQALQLAERLLPLHEIATGPAEEVGLSREFDVHDTLLMVVQSLVDKPGRGLELLDTALQSPVTRVRRGALRVLVAWADEGALVAESEHAVHAGGSLRGGLALLERAAAREVDEELAAEMNELRSRSQL